MVNSSLNWGYEFIFLFLIWKYAHLGKKSKLEKMLDNKDNLKSTFSLNTWYFTPFGISVFIVFPASVHFYLNWIKLFSHMCMPVEIV